MGDEQNVKPGIGLALSGGGFRATLFHLGSLWRLNELGYLPRLTEVTSVSGGSITAGLLGLRWKKLSFNDQGVAENFQKLIARPLREFCSRTIDAGSIVAGILLPFKHPSDFVISSYRKHLYRDATLQDLPADSEGPRFTIYATSLQTGVSVRFSRPYLGEYHIGKIESPRISIAQAVAASSAFPPVLCPVTIEDPGDWSPWEEGGDLFKNRKLKSRLILGDGGIYDNLGLERAWDYETVLVSDAGAPFGINPTSKLELFSQVARTKRTLDIMGEQTRALRKRKLIDEFIRDIRHGTYWGISTYIGDYRLEAHDLPGPMVSDNDVTGALCKLRTRLNSFSDKEQGRLINWGYALTDAAMRRHVLPPGSDVMIGSWPTPEFPL